MGEITLHRLDQITNQLVNPEIPEENAHSGKRAAAGAAVDSRNAPIDADLQAIIERWAELPDTVKAGILAMVRAVGETSVPR